MERGKQNGKKDTNQENTFKQKRIKKPYIILLVATTMLIVIIGAIVLSRQSIKTEEPQLRPVIAESVTYRKFDQRTLDITKYEMFYRGSGMYSKEVVEHKSLVETIEKYALFYYLEQHDYKWDEEKRNFYRKLSKTKLEQNVKNTNLKVY